MVSDDSQKDRKTKAEAGKDDKMLSVEQVEKLLSQDADAFMKQFEKLDEPQELRRRFNQIIERLEREGLDEPEDEDESETDDEIEDGGKPA